MPGEKPAAASLDWKPSAHKCRDRGSNPGLIGAKREKIRCANLLVFAITQNAISREPVAQSPCGFCKIKV